MKSAKKVSVPAAAGERKSIRMDGVEASESLPEGPFDEKEIERRAAYFLLNGMPPLVVNALGEDRYRLLSGAADYFAAKRAGIAEAPAIVYRFSDREAELLKRWNA